MAFNPSALLGRRQRGPLSAIAPNLSPTPVTADDRVARAGPTRMAAAATRRRVGEIFMPECDSENRVRRPARVKHKCHTLEMKQKLFRFAALSTIYIRCYAERERKSARARVDVDRPRNAYK